MRLANRFLDAGLLPRTRIDVEVGDRAEQEQALGPVGKSERATGPHVHWGLNWLDSCVDPRLLLDPALDPQ